MTNPKNVELSPVKPEVFNKTINGRDVVVEVVRLHPTNSSPFVRMNPNNAYNKPSQYVTQVTIYDTSGRILGSGVSRCSHVDTPMKKSGFLLAYKRASGDMMVRTSVRSELDTSIVENGDGGISILTPDSASNPGIDYFKHTRDANQPGM